MKIPCENCNGEGAHLTLSMLENMPDHRLPCENCNGTGERSLTDAEIKRVYGLEKNILFGSRYGKLEAAVEPFSAFETDLMVRSLGVSSARFDSLFGHLPRDGEG